MVLLGGVILSAVTFPRLTVMLEVPLVAWKAAVIVAVRDYTASIVTYSWVRSECPRVRLS